MISNKKLSDDDLRIAVDAIEREWPIKKNGKRKQMGEFSLQIQRELMRRACVRIAPTLRKIGETMPIGRS